MTHRIAITALVSVLFGCAHATTAGPPLRMALDTERLVPDGAPVGRGVTLVASPVQLGAWVGPGEIPGKGVAPVALRVPQELVPTNHWFTSPTVEPSLVSTQIWPRFDLHMIPLLPYGTFWIEVTNQTSGPITLDRGHLDLELAGAAMHAFSDGGEVRGRWNLTLRALWHIRETKPTIDSQVINLHVLLPRLEHAEQLPPGASWKGFVAFDLGNRYTADEYNALLRQAGAARIVLRGADGELASVSFKADAQPLAAVCLPGTKTASYERCEVLVTPETATLDDATTRDLAAGR